MESWKSSSGSMRLEIWGIGLLNIGWYAILLLLEMIWDEGTIL